MTKREIRAVVIILVAALGWIFSRYHQVPPAIEEVRPATRVVTEQTPSTVSSTRITTNALVVKVVDGDTIEAHIDGQQDLAKIRLLGINTPETVDPRRPVQCFGKEASNFAKQLMEGKRIALREDVQADDRDKYGRLLRNVLLEDGTDVNALLIKEGYAYAYVSFPLNKQRKNELRRLQEEASAAKRGLWSPETCDGVK